MIKIVYLNLLNFLFFREINSFYNYNFNLYPKNIIQSNTNSYLQNNKNYYENNKYLNNNYLKNKNNLDKFLLSTNYDSSFLDILYNIFDSCKEISYKIQTASCNKMSCFNQFGDEQLAIDILSDNILKNCFTKSPYINTISSEEEPIEIKLNDNINGYSISFDPLDGSSIIDSNLAVGTIFGIWKGNRLTNIYGRDLILSGMCIYGPRTIMVLAFNNMDGVHEFLLINNGNWINSNYYNNMLKQAKLYSPGNLKIINENLGYKKLLEYWIKNNYQLRYSGGMVPDINQLLVKGQGIFVNVASKNQVPKLRMLYEIAPLGFLIEKAGGKTSDGILSVLDILIKNTNQTSQIAFGSEFDVEIFNEIVGKYYL